MTPFLGSITMFGGNFAPLGWAFCNGQILPINQNAALFDLLGTTYGGDGQFTFALPDLQGRLPVHIGNGFVQGQSGGTETVNLTVAQIPSHSHGVGAVASPASTNLPAGNVAYSQTSPGTPQYAPTGPLVQASPNAVGSSPGNQAHNNMMPFLAVNFIIALEGIFPSQG